MCCHVTKYQYTEYGSGKIKEETEARGIYVCSAAMAVVTAGVLLRRAICQAAGSDRCFKASAKLVIWRYRCWVFNVLHLM